jgi:tetratricopeptide (TPR) repeat protein
MDIEAEFSAVRKDIAEGRLSEVPLKIKAIAESSREPFTIIKCMSIMKSVGDDSVTLDLMKLLLSSQKDDGTRLQSAMAVRSLGYPSNALGILKGVEKDDSVLRESARCFMDLDEHEEALDRLRAIQSPIPKDGCMIVDALSSLGEHSDAVAEASRLLSAYPSDYDVAVCYTSALISAGRQKEAVKYVRDRLKEKSADAFALAGHVMWIIGNVKSAGAYSSRAVQIDRTHIGGMEVLGLCLAEKGEIDKARIVAGAINEVRPGDKAALNIIAYCEMKGS